MYNDPVTEQTNDLAELTYIALRASESIRNAIERELSRMDAEIDDYLLRRVAELDSIQRSHLIIPDFSIDA